MVVGVGLNPRVCNFCSINIYIYIYIYQCLAIWSRRISLISYVHKCLYIVVLHLIWIKIRLILSALLLFPL